MKAADTKKRRMVGTRERLIKATTNLVRNFAPRTFRFRSKMSFTKFRITRKMRRRMRMMLILKRVKKMRLLPMGIIPPSCGIFISIVVRMTIRTEMIPIMRSSFLRFFESGESSFSILLSYPPTQKATVFKTVDECVEGTLRSSYERSGVCFGGFRPTKHVEEPRASVRGGST
jgi:hypothetical protein